jgi:hypothetical protein
MTLQAQSGCPGCVVTLPTLAADTIYLGAAPNGRAGEHYEADISFRMPKTTTPVAANDSTVAPGITISQINITSVTNLPPGLSWQANKTEFNVATETDGCVRFCGTPLQPGLYEVEVVVTAKIFVISRTTSFSFPIYIAPAVSATEGFTMENGSGCGEVTVDFNNRVKSNNRKGFSYLWNFGNGQTSIDENPFSQTYRQPGNYLVNYRAIVDTAGFFLTGIRVEKVSCTDFLGRPDVYVEILNPKDSVIFRSETVNNATMPVSVSARIPIGEGNYKIRVRDEDDGLGGAYDECGTVTFNRLSGGSLEGVDFKTTITLIHPVDTIRSQDTVRVFAQPTPPTLSGYNGAKLCQGDSVRLRTNYTTNLQWFKDSSSIFTATNATYAATETGTYRVQYTSAQGCRAVSQPLSLNFAVPPAPPVFTNTNNQLRLFDVAQLPASYHAEWFLEDRLLLTGTNTALCAGASGTYVLTITDLLSGCSNSHSRIVTYNPNTPCSTPVENMFDESVSDLSVFPNPTDGRVWLKFGVNETLDATVVVRNAVGAKIRRDLHRNLSGKNTLEINLQSEPAGLYFVELQVPEGKKSVKVVKR